MRKIEREMLKAIHERKNWRVKRTGYAKPIMEVVAAADHTRVYLHGNHIASIVDGYICVNRITLRRWPTNTTKSRLRALGVNLETRKGQIFIDGTPL